MLCGADVEKKLRAGVWHAPIEEVPQMYAIKATLRVLRVAP